MEINDFDKLEEKITSMVNNLQKYKEENKKLKQELTNMKRDFTSRDEERIMIKSKVVKLIDLIETIEK